MASIQLEKKQKGAALVVSLVLLAVVTLLGVAGMQNSTLELKMTGITRDRAEAFQAAEAALLLAEQSLKTTPPTLNQLSTQCDDAAGCYRKCAEGICFKGIYNNGDGKFNCQVLDSAATSYTDTVAQLLADNSKKIVTNVSSKEVGVFTEFLCFVEKYNARIPVNSEENSERQSIDAMNDNFVPLFRLTALAKGNSGRASVVLQSTFKLVN